MQRTMSDGLTGRDWETVKEFAGRHGLTTKEAAEKLRAMGAARRARSSDGAFVDWEYCTNAGEPERTINGLVPSGFVLALPEAVDHPDNPTGRGGSLIRCEATGIYCLLVGGAVMSVPQRWARGVATAQRLKVPIYREHCVMAGRVCMDGNRIDSGSDGLDTFEGTALELLKTAVRLENQAATAGAGHDAFLMRCAASLREAVQ